MQQQRFFFSPDNEDDHCLREGGDDILNGVKDNYNDDATGDDDYKKVNDHFNDDDVVNADAVKIVMSLS